MKTIIFTTFTALLAAFLGAGIASGMQHEKAELQISAQQLNSEQIRELQQSLQEQGVDPGPVDGIMGPRTRQALQRFQQQENLAASGDINEKTLEALDLEAQEFMGLSPEFKGDQAQGKKPDEAQLRLPAKQLNSAQVREVQQSLQEEGLDPGPMDGKMGPLTRQAIQLFQQQEGLAATGDLNEKTLEALDIEVQEFMGLSPAFGEKQRQ